MSVLLADAVLNIFCPTGPGGGIKPDCGGKGGRGSLRGVYEKVKRQVEKTLDSPSTRSAASLERALSTLSVRDLQRLKREMGIRAGGYKAQTTRKLAEQITRNVSAVEKMSREARALGHSKAALKHYAHEYRKLHNEQADRVNAMLREVRKRYEGLTGKKLSRNNPAFNGGDYTKLKGWDEIARTLAGDRRFSDLLHDAGYRGRGDEKKAYQTLFELYKAGNVPRMGYREGYEKSLDYLRQTPAPPKARRSKAQDEEPFDLF